MRFFDLDWEVMIEALIQLKETASYETQLKFTGMHADDDPVETNKYFKGYIDRVLTRIYDAMELNDN